MAGSKSNDLANKILNHVLGGPDYVRPATVYYALYLTAPDDASGGTEVSASGYARVAVTNNATNFPAASGQAKTNGAAITYPQAGANWGTAVGMRVFDAASGGNPMYWGTIIPRSIFATDIPSWAAGSVQFTED